MGDPSVFYEDLELIGRGSFGAVYRAKIAGKNETVAIKKIALSKSQKNDRGKVEREIDVLRRVNHPNVVKFITTHSKDNVTWIVMEYCVASAMQVVESLAGQVTEKELSAIAVQIAQGLAYLHREHMIHRDVKGANVLFREDGVAKLADLGSTAMADKASTFVGTPYWMAPEMIMAMEEGQYDCMVDVWALGITAIEIAQKQVPLITMHPMSALYHIPGAEPPQLPSDGNWSASATAFIASCLQKDPTKRWPAARLITHEFLARNQADAAAIVKALLKRSIANQQTEAQASQQQIALAEPSQWVSKASWRQHEEEAKKQRKEWQKKRLALEKAQDKEAKELSSKHTAAAARLEASQKAAKDKLNAKLAKERDTLKRCDQADKANLRTSLSSHEASARKSWAAEKKRLMKALRDESPSTAENMRGEMARREQDLEHTLTSQRQREEANLETRIAERQALQHAEHAQTVASFNTRQIREKAEADEQRVTEAHAQTVRHINAGYDLAAAAAESAYHMERNWLQESAGRATERLKRQHQAQAKAAEKLVKTLQADHKRQLKAVAKQQHDAHQVLLKQRLAETHSERKATIVNMVADAERDAVAEASRALEVALNQKVKDATDGMRARQEEEMRQVQRLHDDAVRLSKESLQSKLATIASKRHADLAAEEEQFTSKRDAIREKESADLDVVQQQLAQSAKVPSR